ncbi:MAG: hypothetical protein AABY22_35620 [Nanoarchaeota archaeon]
MATKDRLHYFRGRIDNSTEFNQEFKNLIGIELYDFIYSNELLIKGFEERLHYLDNLAKDKDFIKLQDDLFGIIQKILKLTSLEEVKERQKEWNNALISRLKNVEGRENYYLINTDFSSRKLKLWHKYSKPQIII